MTYSVLRYYSIYNYARRLWHSLYPDTTLFTFPRSLATLIDNAVWVVWLLDNAVWVVGRIDNAVWVVWLVDNAVFVLTLLDNAVLVLTLLNNAPQEFGNLFVQRYCTILYSISSKVPISSPAEMNGWPTRDPFFFAPFLSFVRKHWPNYPTVAHAPVASLRENTRNSLL